jgi:enamine deaminase RidA (YjgF/YER057c/UK114 family)
VDGVVTGAGDAQAQALTAFRIALNSLAGAGARIEDVLRTRMYITNRADADAVGRAHGEIFAAVRPAASLLIVAGLLDPTMLVEVEVEAWVDDSPRTIPA